MRILIGLHEISNIINDFSSALKESGLNVDTVVIGSNKYYKNNVYTYCIHIPRHKVNIKYVRGLINKLFEYMVTISFFVKIIFLYDVVVFIWNKTFLPLKMDLFILRAFKKKVLVFNCGNDVRYRPIHFSINRDIYGYDPFSSYDYKVKNKLILSSNRIFLNKFLTQRIQELSGAVIVTTRSQATFQKKDCYLISLATNKFIEKVKKASRKPLIIHAPSNPAFKGTKIVLNAIELLKNKNMKFVFELIQEKDNEYVLSRLKEADIVIDQPGSWIGKFASEGLAFSCAVIGGNRPEIGGYSGSYFDDSPVIQFEPDVHKLSLTLEELISNIDYRQKVMKQSYIYWKTRCSYEEFGNYFMNLLEGRGEIIKPLSNYKRLLIEHADNKFQKLFIKLFY